MSDYLMLYRMPANSPDLPDSPQRMQERMQKWRAWFGELESKGALKNIGHPLESKSAWVDPKANVHDGPFPESKDLVLGFSIVQAADLRSAGALAKTCPVLQYGGSVEVRPIQAM